MDKALHTIVRQCQGYVISRISSWMKFASITSVHFLRVEKNSIATAVEVKLSDKIDSDGQTNIVFSTRLQFCSLLD